MNTGLMGFPSTAGGPATFGSVTPGTYRYTVPADVTTMRFALAGGAGGNGRAGDPSLYQTARTGNSGGTSSISIPGKLSGIATGGGGGGGIYQAGGGPMGYGGAGGLLEGVMSVAPGDIVTVVVASGGATDANVYTGSNFNGAAGSGSATVVRGGVRSNSANGSSPIPPGGVAPSNNGAFFVEFF